MCMALDEKGVSLKTFGVKHIPLFIKHHLKIIRSPTDSLITVAPNYNKYGSTLMLLHKYIVL